MRIVLACTAVASTVVFVVLAGACKRQDDSASPAMAPSAAYSAYPAPQPTYAQQPAYAPAPAAPAYGTYPPPAAQPAPAAAPAPAPAVTAAPAGSGAMAVPGPVAFQCQNDVPCGTHHCNMQYGKCAFPCQTNVDCIQPNSCMMGLCVPAPLGH